MRSKSLFRGDPKGKTGWELLQGWWHGAPPPEPIARLPNPLRLRPGEEVELSLGRAKRWETEGLFAFFDGTRPLNTRYELARGAERIFLEDYPLEGSERGWLQLDLVEEFELDEGLLEICEQDESLDHTCYDEERGEDEVICYYKEAAGRYQALYLERGTQEPVSAEVLHFHYFSEEHRRYLTVEVWPDERWMRFFVGRDYPERAIMAFGTAPATPRRT